MAAAKLRPGWCIFVAAAQLEAAIFFTSRTAAKI